VRTGPAWLTHTRVRSSDALSSDRKASGSQSPHLAPLPRLQTHTACEDARRRWADRAQWEITRPDGSAPLGRKCRKGNRGRCGPHHLARPPEVQLRADPPAHDVDFLARVHQRAVHRVEVHTPCMQVPAQMWLVSVSGCKPHYSRPIPLCPFRFSSAGASRSTVCRVGLHRHARAQRRPTPRTDAGLSRDRRRAFM
jgi:hypothetical protein